MFYEDFSSQYFFFFLLERRATSVNFINWLRFMLFHSKKKKLKKNILIFERKKNKIQGAKYYNLVGRRIFIDYTHAYKFKFI